ncbi:MAG: acyl carrier protein [Oligoflexales bacterium]|nr:acyl carrier protein [Oligoflexales bacterium]
MTKEQQLEKINHFIIDTFLFGEDRGLKYSDSLLGKGIIDSSGILELVEFLESSFNIQVKDDEIIPDNLDSIEKIGAFVARKS